jgi:hypothetical protein
MTTWPTLIERQTFETERLMATHPPHWHHHNKLAVFEISCPPGAVHGGRLEYSRWRECPLPARLDARLGLAHLTIRHTAFDYAPSLPGPDVVEWHVNFADPQLFGFYGSALFAQDEMQVTEHPALGALKEALDAAGTPGFTVDGGRATPVLVMGVERRCQVETAAAAAAGRPRGLYGKEFVAARLDVVRRSTTRLDPPTVSNIVAMAAPRGAHGRYTVAQIEHVLATSLSGLGAAVLESRRAGGPGCRIAVHTGYWGCGAFGGNRVLMTLLQVVAAGAVGVDSLVFHTVTEQAAGPAERAREWIQTNLVGPAPLGTGQVLERLDAASFEWGVSDGT